ncbi:MAG: hypothetical protein H2055_00970 [Sphingopyxis sp.]|nr:hypothetical protein [Sphingopyxis sp.]
MTSRAQGNNPGDAARYCIIRGGDERDKLAAIARREAQDRRRRNRLIRYEFFAEPAWDMLLELYIHRHGGRSIDAGTLCGSTVASPATALRWMRLLIDQDLVVWSQPGPGENDVQIALSERGAQEIEHYLRDRLAAARPGTG